MSVSEITPRACARSRTVASGRRSATVLGLGSYLPANVVPNRGIADRIGVDDAWIVRRTGIRFRRRAAADERLSDLAAAAGSNALASAGVKPGDLDLVLVATISSDEVVPNAAPVVAHALGAHQAGAMDIGAACAGWLGALALGCGQVEAGRAERVLVIGADVLSRLTDPDDRSTAALFGDGAGAVVLGPGGSRAPGLVGPILMAADGALGGLIVVSHEDRRVRMNGHDTFRHAVKSLADITNACVANAGLTLDDVDLFVFHQANGRILQSVRERLKLPADKVADYTSAIGNTSAASIPVTLALLAEDGRLRPGLRVLVGATGAGFVWGAGILEWELGRSGDGGPSRCLSEQRGSPQTRHERSVAMPVAVQPEVAQQTIVEAIRDLGVEREAISRRASGR